ncbi:mast/stem cell growth factor receptor kita-like [Schistocerca cancellata]|uniref:mast/stem cell growth factor receptor kita-like n=1 Tax=Schistocerca cancellata TaxID=274614 RepID=UPI0021194E9B|nr:mast/stem cell growth factor receptor kita-like [Schistocerca cancellata]XP_049766458.1 mast/stem cell growth factor receptor kita-like [Schistocerca cancellata]
MLLLAVALSTLVLVGVKSDGPRITSPKDETVVQKGETITVVCEGEGDLKWEYPEYSGSKVNVTNEHHKTTLKRYQANYLDVGYYICYTENNYNKIKNQVYIYVKDEQQPIAMATKRIFVTVEPSGTVIVPCRPTSPDVKLHLIKLEEAAEVLPEDDERITVSKEGFVIHSVSLTDNGNYVCCLYGADGQCDETHRYDIRINVKKTLGSLPLPEVFGPKYAVVGSTVAMFCNVTTLASAQLLQLKWIVLNETYIKTGHVKTKSLERTRNYGGVSENVYEEVIIISNITTDDAGAYTCEVRNDKNAQNKSIVLHVRGDSFVDVSFSATKDVTVNDGENVTWVAYIDAFPNKFSVVWKSPQDKEIDPVLRYSLITNSKEIKFSIQNVTTKDQGRYTVVVQNSGSEFISYPTLTVRGKPTTWIVNNQKKIFLAEKETYIVKCEVASGSSLVIVSWNFTSCTSESACTTKYLETEQRNNADGVRNGSFLTSTYKFSCEIPGNLSCIASDDYGIGSNTIEIICEGVTNAEALTAGVVCAALVLISIVAVLAFKLIKEKKLRKKLSEIGLENFVDGAPESMNPNLPLDEQAELLPYNKIWEFPREKLKFGKQLGSGAFGVVVKADAYGILEPDKTTTVAVKMVKQNVDITYIKALASELKIMCHLGKHLNIVNLLGACTDNLSKRELLVIVEYCRFGNLHSYLIRNRKNFIDQIDPGTDSIDPSICIEILSRPENSQGSSRSKSRSSISSDTHQSNSNSAVRYIPSSTSDTSEHGQVSFNPSVSGGSRPQEWCYYYKCDDAGKVNPVCTHDLVCWSYQIANGMDYLAQRKVLHGDLAARNILLADGNVVKICDFGLAKNMYRSNIYKKKSSGPLPFKWMAIEAIKDRIFSTQSDVWSYGVTLWELFSLATTPYPGMEPDERLLQRLINGYRMEKPQYATNKIYEIMLSCWHTDPNKRVTFSQLVEEFGNILGERTLTHYHNLNDEYISMSPKPGPNGDDYLAMAAAPDYNKLLSPVEGENHSYINSNPLSSENPEIEHIRDYTDMNCASPSGYDVSSIDTGFHSDGSQNTTYEARDDNSNKTAKLANVKLYSHTKDSQKDTEKQNISPENNGISNPAYFHTSL